MKLLVALAASISSAALVLAIIAVFNIGSEAEAQPGSAGGDNGAAAAADAVVQVELSEFALVPEMLHAAAGSDVTIEVTNAGGIQHDLVVEGVGQTALLDAGATEALSFGYSTRGRMSCCALCPVMRTSECGPPWSWAMPPGVPTTAAATAPTTAR
ncbi:MAG: hypothetical protein GEU80_03685 [Dehalococcoidia bacterium]|nr:hypothetical protein [Dehalococcoidia bacterium]